MNNTAMDIISVFRALVEIPGDLALMALTFGAVIAGLALVFGVVRWLFMDETKPGRH